MELIDYPQAINEEAHKCLEVFQQVQQQKSEIDCLVNAVFCQVTFDPTLKNQNQRDARKATILAEDRQYTEKLAKLQTLKNELVSLKIHLEYLRNKFAAVRLAAAVKLDVITKLGDTATAETLRAHLAGMALQSVFSSVYLSQTISPLEVAEQAVTFADALVSRLEVESVGNSTLWEKKVYAQQDLEEEEFDDDSDSETTQSHLG